MSRLAFIAALCAWLCLPNARSQTTIRVSPIGATADTITLAQALIKLKDPTLRDDKGNPKENIVIQMAPGIYRLTEPLKLDAASSGSASHPVTIQGPSDGSAIISGGRAVNGFVHVTDRAMLARLPPVARANVLQANLPSQGTTDYGVQARHGWGANNVPAALELIYRDQPMPLARWPNHDFTKIATTPGGTEGLIFTANDANLIRWQDETKVLATGYWSQNWADATIPIEAIDIRSGWISLTPPLPPFGVKIGQRVFFQNILAELDRPGEWYLDQKTGNLYFWPPEILQDEQMEVTLTEKLLIIENASHIKLNSITFQNSRSDALTVLNGNFISLNNSRIRNVGNWGAVISGENSGIYGVQIENTGAGGVWLRGGDRQTLTSANLFVENSTIQKFGRISRTYQPAILMVGVGHRATENKISDSPHAAIIFIGNNHLISSNEIFDVCKESGDAGAIYTGRDWTTRGTLISFNYLHDIPSNIDLGRTKGVYLDDQASGIIISHNLFVNVEESIIIGGGRDNLVEDNIFLNGNIAIHLDARGARNKGVEQGEGKTTLMKRLEAVPYKGEIYSRSYPNLSRILEDNPEMPKYNIAQRNMVIGNSKFRILENADSGITFINNNFVK